jgi:hypothetical protein
LPSYIFADEAGAVAGLGFVMNIEIAAATTDDMDVARVAAAAAYLARSLPGDGVDTG